MLQLSGADWASGDVRAAVAVVPALGGEVAALQREGADPAETEVLGDLADLGLLVGVERVVAEGVGRDQARVVVVDRQQVTGREVAGLDPLAVRHPLGRDDGLVAGDAARSRRSSPTSAAARGPRSPTSASRGSPGRSQAKRWVTRRSPSTTWREVLPHVGGVDLLEQRGAGRVDRCDGGGIGLGAHGGHHGRNHDPWRHRRCQVGPVSRSPRRPRQHGAGGCRMAGERAASHRGRASPAGRGRGRDDPGRRPAGRRAGRRRGAGRPGRARPASPSARRAGPPAPRAPATPGSRGSSRCTPSTPPATPRWRSRWPAPCSSRCPTGEARGQVALFLGLTMLPFAIVAPLIGPFLDRFSHGRRWAIGATMAIRGFLCWVLATAVVDRVDLAVPGGAGRAGRVQGVRRDAGRRRTPAACRAASPWSRPTPGSRSPASSGPADLGPDRRAGGDLRAGVVAALRVRALRDRHDPGDPAAAQGRRRARASSGSRSARAARPAPPAGVRSARCHRPSRSRCARNCGPRWLSGFLLDVHGVPAAREPDRRLGGRRCCSAS